jgi:hypothetical protein
MMYAGGVLQSIGRSTHVCGTPLAYVVFGISPRVRCQPRLRRVARDPRMMKVYRKRGSHGRLFAFGSREEIYSTHRGIDLLAQIDPSGLWQEVLLQLTAWTVNHEDDRGQRTMRRRLAARTLLPEETQ